MSNQNWRAELERLAMLRQRQANGIPSTAELLQRMVESGELDFLDQTKEKA